MSIETLVKAEQEKLSFLLNTTGPIGARQTQAMDRFIRPPMPPIPPTAQKFPTGFFASRISAEVYLLLQREHVVKAPVRITDEHIAEAKAYTSDLLGVSLANVRVEIVAQANWDLPGAEGLADKCGVDNHVVFMPEFFTDPVEVLCHEFGHAGHWISARQTAEYPYFFQTLITQEFVAHFCQYNYLLDRMGRSDFVTALGQLFKASYALSMLGFSSRMKHEEPNGLPLTYDRFAQSPEAWSIHQALPDQTLRAVYKEMEGNYGERVSQACRGIALLLTLLLIDERDGVRKLMAIDRIDLPLAEKLATAFPKIDVLKALPHVNKQIFKLLQRFAT